MRDLLKTIVACCAVVLGTGWLPGGGAVCGADPEVVFEPPKAVVVRQSNGLPARGELLRMNADTLWLRALNGKEVRLKLENVRSIKSSDESFEYRPGEETFGELSQRIGSVSGASLNGSVAASPRGTSRRTQTNSPKLVNPGQMDPDARKEARRAARVAQANPVGGAGRDGNSPVVPPLRLGGGGSDDPASDRANESPGDPAVSANDAVRATSPAAGSAAGTEVLLCSECEQELPAGFTGGACPHCGKQLAFEDTGPTNPFEVPTGAPGRPANPFATNSAPTTPPTAAMPALQPAAAAPAPAPGEPAGLSNMPLIAKVGIFAGFVIGGWFLLMRR